MDTGGKRPRDPSVPDGAQTLEEKGEERIIKNSPYGASRSALGWGSPFQKARKAVSVRYPSVRIGMSSLNGTPGKDRKMDKLLQQYLKKFTALEHCNPYHAMNDPEQWIKWAGMVPTAFTFTVKANQYLTHIRQLQFDDDTAAHISNFFVDRVAKLGPKLGAVLVQLPPSFRCIPDHLARLDAVATAIPSTIRIAVEFRHPSWFCDAAYDVLRRHKWALVATHNHDVGESPVIDTGAGFLYVRLHGAVAQYAGDYGAGQMRRWASIVKRFIAENGSEAPVYFCFNNNESHIGSLTSSVCDATALADALDRDDDDVQAAARFTSAASVATAPAAKPPPPTTTDTTTTPAGGTTRCSGTPPAAASQAGSAKDEAISVE